MTARHLWLDLCDWYDRHTAEPRRRARSAWDRTTHHPRFPLAMAVLIVALFLSALVIAGESELIPADTSVQPEEGP